MSPVGGGEGLIVIDMLNDFILPGAPLEVPAARNIIPAVKRRLADARSRGAAVIYVCDAHAPEDEEFKAWPAHAVRGSDGAKVIEELAPQPGDAMVEKTTYAVFYGTDLERVLADGGVRRLTLVGVLTNICIFYAAMEAVVRGFEVEVPRDCVASLSREDDEFALGQMERVLKVEVV
jgi:nicotinamidase/pyrazinamidase